MPFSPRFAGQCRDRSCCPDGSPLRADDMPDAAWMRFVASIEPEPVDLAVLEMRLTPDAAPPDADLEWEAYLRRLERPKAARHVSARHWCGMCSAFVSGPDARCAKCRHTGPHTYGEDSPLAGNATRRARLQAKHRATRSIWA